MRKSLLALVLLLLVSGCSSSKRVNDQEKYKKYNAAIEQILNNNGAVSSEIPFNYAVTISKVEEDNTYEYAVILDQPQVAMYDIEAIAIDISQVDSGVIFPSAGIVDSADSMVPFQVDAQQGFPKGIVLNGISQSPTFTLHLMVSWKDYAKLNQFSAFFAVDVALQEESE